MIKALREPLYLHGLSVRTALQVCSPTHISGICHLSTVVPLHAGYRMLQAVSCFRDMPEGRARG